MRLAFWSSLLFWSVVVVAMSGCTFQIGIDYRGKTGVDNRTASTLAPVQPVRVQQAKNELR